jgi:hypothetical protein
MTSHKHYIENVILLTSTEKCKCLEHTLMLLFSHRLSVCSWNVRTAMTVLQVKRVLILAVWIPARYQMCVDSMQTVNQSTMLECVRVSLVTQATPILAVFLCSTVAQTPSVRLVPHVAMGSAHVSTSSV